MYVYFYKVTYECISLLHRSTCILLKSTVSLSYSCVSVECCGRCCDLPQDCQAIRDMGHLTNGVYHVYPDGVYSGFEVYCDMETDDGGWLVRNMRGKTPIRNRLSLNAKHR